MDEKIAGSPGRQLLHTRQVVCTGYLRDDGLFDIEGRLLDTKGIDTEFIYGIVAAGGVLHQMRMVMTLDERMVIRHIEAHSELTPTPVCPHISSAYAALQGLRIGPGFKRRAAELVGGVKGCTHLTEMLGPMATTAVQTMAPVIQKRLRERTVTDPTFEMPRHWVIGTCHAYHPEGDAARRVGEWSPDGIAQRKPETP